MSRNLFKIIAPFNYSEKFCVPSLSNLLRKINKFKSEGINNFEVISDFDFTLTRFNANGYNGKTSVTLAQTTGKSETRLQEVQDLHDFYSPIEHSNTITESLKAKHMNEWWHRSSAMLISDQIEKKDIESMVLNSNVYLRACVKELISRCKFYSVPFTIVSAGFGNVVEGFFKELGLDSAVKVFSNFLLEDENFKLAVRTEPYIISIEKNKVLADYKLRSNILLLGDMISDCLIIKDSQYSEALKIGFFNNGDEGKMQNFLETFDLIILNDGNLYLVDMIAQIIAGENSLENFMEHLDKNI